MGSHPLRHKVLLPQLKMIVLILMALLTCGGGQQIPPPDRNTLILRNVIDTLGTLSQQLKEFQVTVEAKFEEVQTNVTGIIETQKTIQADIKQVQGNVTGIIETQKTIQADIKEMQGKISAIDESQKSGFRNMEGLQQCSTKVQLSQFQELVFKDPCEDGSHNCSDMSTCTDYVNRYECSCLAGYSGDGFTCQDVDECREEETRCPQNEICLNKIGSYRCICPLGYKKVGDICQGPVCEPPSLLVSEIGCLTFVKEDLSWDASQSKCEEELGGRLAEGIHRRHLQALSDHFYPIMGGYNALWVGLRRRQWIHQEEEEEKDLKDEDWREGEPNGDLEQCGYLRLNSSSLGLGDYLCSWSASLLCQSLP